MDIISKKIDELTPYERNPRKNEAAIDAVAASIKNFGFKVPIVIDQNGIIVAGHTRLAAAKKLGLEEVPCIIADDLSEEQIKAFRLADNKTSELAAWDPELLEIELSDIGTIDMKEFGFIDPDISDEDNMEDQNDIDLSEVKGGANNVNVRLAALFLSYEQRSLWHSLHGIKNKDGKNYSQDPSFWRKIC